ncbi:uncharacterized protein LOC143551803 [Bidens hawaiensis]|uniref:uncharacterized protein LOC143551803 n=1 Tax=Bidens hawaiensis TaxID=980011 RepID=UPI00404B880F
MYAPNYLRTPNFNDLERIYEVHARVHGLPGMIGSIDCMHWEWANCPTAWRGQYTPGNQKRPTVSLQAISSYDLWIWSAFFGVVGSNNDINVLEQAPVMEGYISNTIPIASFWRNDNHYQGGYYLGDGIYPEYAIIMKTFRDPINEKETILKNCKNLRDNHYQGGYYLGDGIYPEYAIIMKTFRDPINEKETILKNCKNLRER